MNAGSVFILYAMKIIAQIADERCPVGWREVFIRPELTTVAQCDAFVCDTVLTWNASLGLERIPRRVLRSEAVALTGDDFLEMGGGE